MPKHMNPNNAAAWPRREMLRLLSSAIAGGGVSTLMNAQAGADDPPPVRAITRWPKFHWFGYYDKWQFDPTGRYALGCEVDFEHRSPTPDDVIRIGMVDLKDGDRWLELGETRAWNWQQTCMLQFIPGSQTDIIIDVSGITRKTI